jgi:RNA polymerase sigma-70 factor (ECF subfamily)
MGMADRLDFAAPRDRAYGGPVPALESDEALAARAAMDPNAFAELYRRYVDRIRSYCGFRLRDRATVEDVTSEIFVKALESLHKTAVTNVRPWLFTIAHNQVTDRYRRARDEVDLAAAAGLASQAPSPESIAVAGSERDALYAAIALLKPDQARVIELRLSGLDGPEIRSVLNKSRSWVDTTQYRALIQLRQLLVPGQSRSPETT